MGDARTEALTGCEVCGLGVKDSELHAAWHRALNGHLNFLRRLIGDVDTTRIASPERQWVQDAKIAGKPRGSI